MAKQKNEEGFIVPVSEDGQLTVSDSMRADAAASVANIEVSRPYLYLCNADAKVVVERQQAVAGDFVVLGLGGEAVNMGKDPMFIVISHHVRFNYYETTVDEKGRKKRKFVWDAAREAMNNEQARQADLNWSDPRSARPYDSYTLIHVAGSEVDPLGIGPLRFKSSANSADESKKWKQDIVNNARKGLAAFATVWRLKGRLKDTGYDSKKYTFDATVVGVIPDTHPAYGKLKQSWQHEQVAMNKAKAQVHTSDPNDNLLPKERDAVKSVRQAFSAQEASDAEIDSYAASFPSDGEEDPPF